MRRLQPPRGFGTLFKEKGDGNDGQGGTNQQRADSAEHREDGTRHPLAEISPSVGSDKNSEQHSGSFSPVQPDSNRDSVSSSDGQVSDLPGDGSTEGTEDVRTEGILNRDGSDFQPGGELYSEGDSEEGFVADYSDKLKFVLGLSIPHYEELKQSAISDEIAALNFQSSDDLSNEVDLTDVKRTNTGRVAGSVLRKLSHYEHGGWAVRGIDPTTGEAMDWGQVKLNRPRWDSSKGKPIKYEATAGMATRLYFLRIPFEAWRLIAKRYKVAMPEIEPDNPQLAWKFWQWVRQFPEIPILLTEGAKKAAALLSAGYVAVASPGIWNFTPNKQIHEDLKPFVSDGRTFYIAFDEDSKASTRGTVAKAAKRLNALLKKEAKVEVKMMSWSPDDGKGIDDVIARFNADKLHKIYREALNFEVWEVKALKGLRSREADLYINDDNRYLYFDAPLRAALIAIKAPKGTGKTEWFARYVKEILKSGSRPVICLAHRIKLMMQTASRVGVKYIEDCTPEEMLKGLALCIDSFRPGGRAQVEPEMYRNAIVFIDEVCQVVFHLLNSDTCQKYRTQIMQCFKELLQAIASFDGQVVIADADLNDPVLELIEDLMGEKAYLVVKDYQGENNFDVINFPQPKPHELLVHFYKSVKAGKKCLMLTDAQQEVSPYSSVNIESKLREQLEVSCLRIDGNTAADLTHPASRSTSHPEVLKNYQVTIATGVIETGVSIDFEYFDEVYLIGNGVVACNSARQFLSRYRIPCPRFVWIKKTGNNYIGNKGTTPQQLYAAEQQKDKAILGQFVQLGIDSEGEQIENGWLKAWAKLGAIHNSGNKRYREQILEDLASEGHRVWSQEDWVKAQEVGQELGNSSPVEVLNNCQSFVEQIPEEKSEELNIRIAEQLSQSAEEGKVIKVEAKEISISNLNRKGIEVNEAEDIPDEDYQEKKQQTFKTQAEQNSIAKRTLENRYGKDNISPELYAKDKLDRHYYSALRIHYHFTIGREFLKEKMGCRWENILTEKRFIPDSNRTMSHLLKVKVLDKLRVNEILGLEEIHNNHPLAISIFESIGFAQNDEGEWQISNWDSINDIATYLGLNLSKARSPIDAIKRIVGTLGLRMPLLRKEGGGRKGSQRLRVYGKPIADWQKDDKGKPIIIDGRAVEIPDGREDIFAVWLERDAEAKEKRAEAKREQQEKESAAAAYAERVKTEIESSQKPEPDYTPKDFVEWAFHINKKYLNDGVRRFSPESIAEAGVEWAGECIERLEWLMNCPQLISQFAS